MVIAGRYDIEREVGRGGMGAVWLARDTVLGRPVALKRLGFAPGAADPDLARAGREARLAARLSHPHVVAVFDLVTEGDDHWLVMEYVEGETLAGLVRRTGALPIDRAAIVIQQAADALAAAHADGIVHRDVKPSNILVTSDGVVKLSDFGIARAQADVTLTQTGLVTGSPAYLAPEVASGQSATAASDVWSLGATLFHALAGHSPYEVGENVLGALYRIVHEDPPRLASAGWLDPVLRATMAIDPAERWSSAQVRDFLAAGPQAGVVVPQPVGERTQELRPARTRRTGWWPAVAVALVALVAGLLVWLGTRDDEPSATGDGPGGGATSSSTGQTSGGEVTADGMENFIEDYLVTVTSDQAAAWEQLTSDFQEASGGFESYQRFWSRIRTADLLSATPDPDSGEISYTVEYQYQNGRKTSDQVTLQLEGTDGDYRIAGER